MSTPDKKFPSPDSKLILTSLYALCLLLVFILATSAAAAVKPYQWTTAQAASAIRVYGDELAPPRDFVSATCRGTGTKITGRFVTFRCRVTLEDGRMILSAKTRRAGGLCFATGVVPSGCLAAGKRARGSITTASTAVYAKLGPPAQTFAVTAHGSGFYSWTWVSGEVEHRGTVTFAKAPIVRVLS